MLSYKSATGPPTTQSLCQTISLMASPTSDQIYTTSVPSVPFRLVPSRPSSRAVPCRPYPRGAAAPPATISLPEMVGSILGPGRPRQDDKTLLILSRPSPFHTTPRCRHVAVAALHQSLPRRLLPLDWHFLRQVLRRSPGVIKIRFFSAAAGGDVF